MVFHDTYKATAKQNKHITVYASEKNKHRNNNKRVE